jgi:hypothetical protein
VPEFNLRPYQVDNLGVALKMKKHLDISHPGTGKSGTASVLAYYHWAKHQKKTLYVMPQSLLRNNRTKMLQFTDFRPEQVEVLVSDHAAMTKKWTGPTKSHPRKVKSRRVRITPPVGKAYNTHEKIMTPAERLMPHAFIAAPDGTPQMQKGYSEPVIVKDLIADCKADVILVTYAFLRMHWRHLLTVHPTIDLLMADEAHLGFKRPGSGVTEAMWFVNQHVNHFYPMTGSLPDGQLDSLFPILHAIEPLYYGSHEGFLNEHAGFIDDYGRVQFWTNTEKLKTILSRHSTCRTFTECYGEEPVVFLHEYVELTPKCREEYDKFHNEAMLELEDGMVLDGTLPGVAVIRARQIMAHPETMALAKGESTGKDERLKIFAAEGQKMIVFAALKPEQRRCVEVLQEAGLCVGLINSDIPKPQRDRVDLAFRSGQLDAVVASGPTAGVGYDWEIADHVINVSVDYQDVNFLQGYRRASRGTRTTTLRVTSLEYEDTIDARLYQILTEKSALANLVDPTRKVLSFTG